MEFADRLKKLIKEEEEKNIRIPTPKIHTIEGYLSFDGCRKDIELHAKNININVSNTLINNGRIISLRSLLGLFESYNDLLRESELKES